MKKIIEYIEWNMDWIMLILQGGILGMVTYDLFK